ncbi:MAG: glycogen synthase [Myxococcales bacterium]|nr:glycogen synthase [Myxococcales bacterium]
MTGLRVLHVSSEVAPFTKTGGLGEVLGALPAAQRQIGLDARVFTPLYGFHDRAALRPLLEPFTVDLGPHRFGARLHQTPDGRVIFADVPSLLDRETPYGDAGDNPLRFAVFSKLAAQYARRCADVVHAHDWQAGLTGMYLHGDDDAPPVVQTIHNLAYQGACDLALGRSFEVPSSYLTFEGAEFHGRLSFLKAGLTSARLLTTVSPRYAREILDEPGGHGLAGLLRHRVADLHGILNGIDTSVWDPRLDPHLQANFDLDDLGPRERNTDELRRAFGLRPDTAVVGIVSRATWQKGLDLLIDGAEVLVTRNLSFVVLCDGDPDLLHALTALHHRFPDRFAVITRFDEALAHRIYGGVDFVLVPSRFEPCGLTQLFAMRYGAIPVVRETGGLADTVQDGDTGLTFFDPTPEHLVDALDRAVSLYGRKDELDAIRRRGMAKDSSWAKAALAYETLYRRLT